MDPWEVKVPRMPKPASSVIESTSTCVDDCPEARRTMARAMG